MKKILVITLLAMGICSVQADNMFQNTNPFPQTMPQDMNNIYESKPATMQDEAKKTRKFWFKKGENLKNEKIPEQGQYKIPVYPVPDEAAEKQGFYIFTTN